MYGALRFLAENAVTSEMLTLSSLHSGRVSGVNKIGEGVATMEVSGDFAAVDDLIYTIEIDSVALGQEVGEATFAWRTNLTSGDWEETGVTTRTTPAIALSADGRGSGLSVSFTGGVGDDFEEGDQWQFIAKATYGPAALLDRHRMTYWRSTADTSESIIINFGSAQEITVFLVQDHNLTSGATVKLQANTSDSWTTPPYSYTFTAITDPLFLYLDQEYQYWRVLIENVSNPDGYIEIANLFLGDYIELEQANAWWESSAAPGVVLQSNQSEAGVFRRYVYAAQEVLNLNFGELLSNEDLAQFVALQQSLLSAETNRVLPLWVHLFSDSNDHLWLMDWENLGAWSHTYFAYLLNSGVTMSLKEVVKI